MKTIVQGGDAVKTFARRDSATAALRKLGVKPADYNMFISATTDGRVAVSLERAQEYLQAQLRKVALEETPQRQLKGRTAKEAKTNQIKRPSVAGTIRKLILDGKDNQQIHEIMKRDFGHTEDHATYPAWYRSQMRRDGLIPREPKAKKAKAVKKVAKKQPTRQQARVAKKAARGAKTRVKRDRAKAVASAAKKASSTAQSNINATKRASVKTGNRLPMPAPLSVTLVH